MVCRQHGQLSKWFVSIDPGKHNIMFVTRVCAKYVELTRARRETLRDANKATLNAAYKSLSSYYAVNAMVGSLYLLCCNRSAVSVA